MENADAWRDPNPWHPMNKPIDLKHLGKLLEELGELVEAYQGGPSQAEENEIADVHANIWLVNKHFKLSVVLNPHALEMDAHHLIKDVGNAIAAASRCLIQGIDECEPSTGKLNRVWLEEALTHVMVSTNARVKYSRYDRQAMATRIARKVTHLKAWHGKLDEPVKRPPFYIAVMRYDDEVVAECSCGCFSMTQSWSRSVYLDDAVAAHENYHRTKGGSEP